MVRDLALHDLAVHYNLALYDLAGHDMALHDMHDLAVVLHDLAIWHSRDLAVPDMALHDLALNLAFHRMAAFTLIFF